MYINNPCPKCTEYQTTLEHLFCKYRNLLFQIAAEILNNPQDAEDVLQHTFLKAAEHLSQIDDSVEPRVREYLVTIARHRAIDIYRQKQRHASTGDLLLPPPSDVPGEASLKLCLEQLPPKYRRVLILKYLYGYSNREIASMLKISQANVMKIQQRGKQKLYDLYYR